MKAAIDALGTLTIQSETELEAYALTQWWAHWDKAGAPVERDTKAIQSTIHLKSAIVKDPAINPPTIVIIYGPPGTGKTTHARQLMQHYGRERVLDDWDGKQPLQPGTLVLTTETPRPDQWPPFGVPHSIAISIDRALKNL